MRQFLSLCIQEVPVFAPSCDLPFAATCEMLSLTTSLFYLWAIAGSDNFQL